MDDPPAFQHTGVLTLAWANLSNTPFRYYKKWVNEGGIAAPFIVHWPAGGLNDGRIVRTPFQLTDVLPTVLDVTGAGHPSADRRPDVLPQEGRSMPPVLSGEPSEPATLYWEHCGNSAIRSGGWKLVREYPSPWELYDFENDRTELVDVAGDPPNVVTELSREWVSGSRTPLAALPAVSGCAFVLVDQSSQYRSASDPPPVKIRSGMIWSWRE
jgi:arylsulfatase